MRLLKLYIEDYKNIKDQEFDFSLNSGYITLIGENGSGKSNLLEAISLIFNGLLNNKVIPFSYKIEYEIDGQKYQRGKRSAKINDETVAEKEMSYPSSVIACYSGEDLRLWHDAYEDYHMHYFNRAIKNDFTIPTLLYINRYCWEIAFIALMCAADRPEISSFLKHNLNIKNIEDVTITFKTDDTKKDLFKKHDAINWFNRITNDSLYNINARTIESTDIFPANPKIQKQEKSKTIFQFLYLLSQPKKNNINNVDKLINDITIKIGDIDFNNLSEGEKKLILIECVTKIIGDKDSLILLDEPDAHTHIARKKELLNAIESFKGLTILTTHSPVFADMMRFDCLHYMDSGKVVDMDKIKAITQISNNEISVLEGALYAVSKRLIVTEGPDDVKHIKAAISAMSKSNSRFSALLKIPITFQGGAKLVNEYFNTVLSPLINNFEKIVFVFDYDGEGREGAGLVDKIDNPNNKICSLFYYKEYPIPEKHVHDFFLEDFYDCSVYSEVILPNITKKPTFYEMKKCSTLCTSVKEKLHKKIERNEINDDCFDGYKEFLEQLLEIFNL